MRITIAVGDEHALDQAQLRSLYDWLRADRSVRRTATVTMTSTAPPVPGSQGPGFDALALTLGAGLSAAQLAVAVVQWRATRPNGPTVTVSRPDGSSVSVTGASADQARELLEGLLDGEGCR
ncbi:hypothetical protein [Streptomyces sp. NPDC000983]|uniref:effector-associated constant component EACC1 n=1 Tax=Streptomyces sp. NPDC000983 TaxID=3154373 RepID=UPI00333426D6